MSKNKITLRAGDSAIIVRHFEQGFDLEIYHKHDRKLLTEEDTMFYALLTRGLVATAINDTDQILEEGRLSLNEDSLLILYIIMNLVLNVLMLLKLPLEQGLKHTYKEIY